jgi:fumarate reductase subunit C
MKTYTRPVSAGWWRKNPFYRWYMLRELSCVFITAYALVLLWGLAALAQGRSSYEAWLDRLASPAALVFHAVTLLLVVYHAWTWFKIMPKTLPRVPVPDKAIVISGVSAVIAVSVLLLWAATR